MGRRDNDRTLGVVPLVAIGGSIASVAGSVLDAKSSKDASRSAEKIAQQQAQAARLQLRAQAQASKKWYWIAGAVAVVGVGAVVYYATRRKR